MLAAIDRLRYVLLYAQLDPQWTDGDFLHVEAAIDRMLMWAS